MADFSLTIGGASVVGAGSFEVVDPARGEPFAEAPECSREQLEAAVGAAAEAFPRWRRDEAGRRAALLACAERVEGAAESLARTLTREQGKPLEQARAEIGMAAATFRANAALELADRVLEEDAEQRLVLRHRPLGVVAAITPWNFPLSIAVRKIAPALRAGNTAVLKPSPFTPLATLELGALLQGELPPGVLNVVSGGDALGAWLTEHPAVRKISFTGSVPTGKRILAAAAPDLKRVTLELGGNDPAIVLADADPARVAEPLFWSAFRNAGQVCIAPKRIYAEEAVYRPLVDALAAIARRVVVGEGLDPGTELGPLNNRPQQERVLELIESARAAGGRFECGGEPLSRPGYFVAPALVTGLGDGARLVDEEQFGPVLPIVPVASPEEAVERANASHFGLGGSIWTGDWERGAALAAELECGTGWVNRHGALSLEAPFGGLKWSGLGYENGPWGLAEFTELQVVSAAKR